MRHAHYLSSVNGNVLPSQSVTIECHWTKVRSEKSDSSYLYQLHHGVLVKYRYRQGKPVGMVSTTFRDAKTCIEAIKQFSAPGTLTWIFAFDLKTTLSALGLWDCFLSGEATFEGHDPRNGPPEGGKGKRHWSGYCVLENPPSIVQFRFAGKHGSIKAVDIRNYGIQGWSDVAAGLNDPEWEQVELDQIGQDTLTLTKRRAFAAAHWTAELIGVIEKQGWGSLKETVASLAFYAYRRKYLRHKILVHDNEPALRLEREAYYGGRCEARFLGRVTSAGVSLLQTGIEYRGLGTLTTPRNVWHFDVNSLYSAVVRHAEIPCRFRGVAADFDSNTLRATAASTSLVARVFVETDTPCVPLRVSRDRWGSFFVEGSGDVGKNQVAGSLVIYPVGKFWTTLCGPELSLAYEHGEVLKVGQVATYDSEPIFSEFVNELYALRVSAKESGKHSIAKLCKLLLNSVYGKFAQKSKRWERVKDGVSLEPFRAWVQSNRETGEIEQWRSFAWMVEKLVDEGEHPQSCPVIGAWINSLARVFLWNLINTAGIEEVFYYDTDSIFTTKRGADRLRENYPVCPDQLGAIRQIGEYSTVDFRGYKYYVTPEKVVCSGLPNGSEVKRTGVAEINYDRSVLVDLFQGSAPQAVQVKEFLPAPAVYKHGRKTFGGWVIPWRLEQEDSEQ